MQNPAVPINTVMETIEGIIKYGYVQGRIDTVDGTHINNSSEFKQIIEKHKAGVTY